MVPRYLRLLLSNTLAAHPLGMAMQVAAVEGGYVTAPNELGPGGVYACVCVLVCMGGMRVCVRVCIWCGISKPVESAVHATCDVQGIG